MKRLFIVSALFAGVAGAFATSLKPLDQDFGYAAGSCSVQRDISNISGAQTCNTTNSPTPCLVEIGGDGVQAYSTQNSCITANKLFRH